MNISFKWRREMNNSQLKVAFPTNNRETVEEHFGHCKEFAMFTVNNGATEKTEYIQAPHHSPGVFPKFLHEVGANVIITGGMGQRAVDLFKEREIDVFLGASGSIEESLNTFLKGTLNSSGVSCTHHQDE